MISEKSLYLAQHIILIYEGQCLQLQGFYEIITMNTDYESYTKSMESGHTLTKNMGVSFSSSSASSKASSSESTASEEVC